MHARDKAEPQKSEEAEGSRAPFFLSFSPSFTSSFLSLSLDFFASYFSVIMEKRAHKRKREKERDGVTPRRVVSRDGKWRLLDCKLVRLEVIFVL